jgi:hypothetical protein
MAWFPPPFFIMSVAIPASVVSIIGHVYAPRRATRRYLGTVSALCFAAVVAWTYSLYLGNGPTHYEPIGPDFVASLIIFPSALLAPTVFVYPCVSGTVPIRRIVPIALLASIVALPFWLYICVMVLHYVVGGM